MRQRLFLIMLTILLAAGCGGGAGTHQPSEPIPQQPSEPIPQPTVESVPPVRASDAEAMPVWRRHDQLAIGTMRINPRRITNGNYGSGAPVRDGQSRIAVESYLMAHARGTPDKAPGLAIFRSAPTVHLASGASAFQRQQVVLALQTLNETLPPRWHLRMGADVAPHTTPPAGRIHIGFDADAPDAGTADVQIGADGPIHSARVTINPSRITDRMMPRALAHELLHSLGFASHIESPDSALSAVLDPSLPGVAMSLYPIDRDGLTAAYVYVQPGTQPMEIWDSLGAWADTSTYLVGRYASSDYGIAMRNGVGRPWAIGDEPDVSLADSPLTGSLSWRGTFLGMTPVGAYVVGDAGIRIDAERLLGSVDFTGLETWPVGERAIAFTGEPWMDGDLRYSVEVLGNTFREIGGDDGILTGIFVGKAHEGAAGTLERDDLTGAFGAERK